MPQPAETVLEEQLEIRNQLGLHARAATKLVQTANRFKAQIDIEKDGQTVNGKSIMGILMLVASKGTTILVRARGEDARQALAAIRRLVDDRFGEE